MTSAEQYRAKAVEFAAKARVEDDPEVRAQLEALSLSYLRLAEQADRNAQTDIIYETPLIQPGVQQQKKPHSNKPEE